MRFIVFYTTTQSIVYYYVYHYIIISLISRLRLHSIVCVSRAKRRVIGTCAFHTTSVCADRRRRRQRPNALKFSVSSLTWANPCSFAPVAVRERNAYHRRRRRRRRLRSNSEQMPLKTAQPLASQSPPRIKSKHNDAIYRFARPFA